MPISGPNSICKTDAISINSLTTPQSNQKEANIVKKLCFVENDIDLKTGEISETKYIFEWKNNEYVCFSPGPCVMGKEHDIRKFGRRHYSEKTIDGLLQKGYSSQDIAKQLKASGNERLCQRIRDVEMCRNNPMPMQNRFTAAHIPNKSFEDARSACINKKDLIESEGVKRMREGEHYALVAVALGIDRRDSLYSDLLSMAEKSILWRALFGELETIDREEYASLRWEIYAEKMNLKPGQENFTGEAHFRKMDFRSDFDNIISLREEQKSRSNSAHLD